MRKEIVNEKDLCSAIVMQAVKDYELVARKIKKYKALLKKTKSDKKKVELKEEIEICNCIIKKDLEPFFRGEWCDTISPIDGQKMLAVLKSKYPIGEGNNE